MNWSAPFSVRPYSVRRVAAGFKVFFLVALLALLGLSEAARSGGGFGGRSSGGSSSSSSSRSGGGYSGGYSRGGGYGGPIIINNGGGWGGGWGGGYGGGYGYRTGGLGLLGLLPLLLFGGVALFIIFALVRGLGARRSGNNLGSSAGSALGGFMGGAESAALMVTIIMTEGDDVKRALQSVAQSGDPDSDAGLSQMLQEAALVALRHPERWAYGNVQYATGDEQRTDAQLGAWETQARAAFTDQTTSNYQNRDLNTGYKRNDAYAAHKETGELYLTVSVGAAARGLSLPASQGVSTQSVSAALQAIAGTTPDSLIRAAVVWSPDAPGEFLTEDEAITLYPQAKKL